MKKLTITTLLLLLFTASLTVYAAPVIIYVNGERVEFTDASPIVVERRTLVPVRGVFEKMGFDVVWESPTATMTRGDMTISVTRGDNFLLINGTERIYPEVPPQVIDGRFMLPVRAITDASGDDIEWFGEISTARIYTGQTRPPQLTPVAPVMPVPPTLPVPPPIPIGLPADVPMMPNHEMELWITATASLLNMQNLNIPYLFTLTEEALDREHSIPEGGYFTVREHSRNILRDSWNINNADALRRQINTLYSRGHNENFWAEYFDAAMTVLELYEALGNMEAVVALIEEQLGERDARIFFYTLELVEYWGEAGIIAWDLFRIGTLISWGFAAQMIDYMEAVQLMEPAANLLKLYFNDWEEAVMNYLDGLIWWSRFRDVHRAEQRENFFRVEIPEEFEPIFIDSLFDVPPTIGLQRAIRPSPGIIEGEWRNIEYDIVLGPDMHHLIYFAPDWRLFIINPFTGTPIFLERVE